MPQSAGAGSRIPLSGISRGWLGLRCSNRCVTAWSGVLASFFLVQPRFADPAADLHPGWRSLSSWPIGHCGSGWLLVLQLFGAANSCSTTAGCIRSWPYGARHAGRPAWSRLVFGAPVNSKCPEGLQGVQDFSGVSRVIPEFAWRWTLRWVWGDRPKPRPSRRDRRAVLQSCSQRPYGSGAFVLVSRAVRHCG